MSRSHALMRTTGLFAIALTVAMAGCGTASGEPPPRSFAGSAPTFQPASVTNGVLGGDAGPEPVTTGPTYYIVVTSPAQQHAEHLRMAEVNQRLAAGGEQEIEIVLVVIRSDDDVARVRRAVAEINVLRDAEELAAIRVLDRRSP